MSNTNKKEHIVLFRILYTALIILFYMIGRTIPVYGASIDVNQKLKLTMEGMLMQTIGGDRYRCSLLALGISPYMLSNIIVQMIAACKKSVSQSKVSMKKMSRMIAICTFIFACIQAYFRMQELSIRFPQSMVLETQLIAGLELVTGALMIVWLTMRNQKYGIGGQNTIILANILSSMTGLLSGFEIREIQVLLGIVIVTIFITVLMENTEKHIPVQRVSIHNVYADKNYIAIKLNPIGVMPAMFSTAFFLLPQLGVMVLNIFFPDIPQIIWFRDNLTLAKPFGIGVYIGILYFLTILFSTIMVSPGELAEDLLKSGDSIVDLHAGRDTKKYLRRNVLGISLFSATVMGICIGVPLVLQMNGRLDSRIMMLPASVIMLTGVWCNLFREIQATKSIDSYRPFL